MAQIWAADCSPWLAPAELSRAMPLLDAARQQAVSRFADPLRRAQCAAAGLLLRHLFSADGTPPVLTHGSHGKPYLANEPHRFFSLSHTGCRVYCAVAQQEIGMDAETAGRCRDRVARRCFTAAELAWMAEAPDERFVRLWVLKEAYLKFTGFGLVLPMSSFTVPPAAAPSQGPGGCRFAEAYDDGVYAAVCLSPEDRYTGLRTLPTAQLYTLARDTRKSASPSSR